MAHFAELDENNIVVRVIVISNDDLLDENGVEQESLGVAVCQAITGGGTWVQTSYNHNFRKQYASLGYAFEPEADVFYDPVQPFPSWSLNTSTYDWEAPVPRPDNVRPYVWDEEQQSWVLVNTTNTQIVELG